MSPKGSARVAHVNALDLLAMLWRERRTAALAGLVILALGAALVVMTPRSFEARTRLLVRMGQEYVFQPRVGAVGAGAMPRIEAIINAELRLLESPEVARRTIARVGLKRLYPDIAGAGPIAQAAAEKAFARDFTAALTPDTPMISLRFAHKNRAIAGHTLDALVAEYLAYRRKILIDPSSNGYAEQARDFARRAEVSAAEIRALLAESSVADFDGAFRSATDLLARLDLDRAVAAAERRGLEARASALRKRVAAQSAEIELYADTDAEKSAGPSRRGPNPVRQALETELYQSEAGARAQAARETALGAQQFELAARVRTLQQIEPRYRDLARTHMILEDNARAFTARAEEASAFSALQAVETDNIRQLEPAQAPLPERSLRLEIMLLALAIFGAVAGALIRGLGRKSFPTPSSAARTLDAPVLGVALFRRAA